MNNNNNDRFGLFTRFLISWLVHLKKNLFSLLCGFRQFNLCVINRAYIVYKIPTKLYFVET
jgi:hypothetical protein